jgi:peroxiredoxin
MRFLLNSVTLLFLSLVLLSCAREKKEKRAPESKKIVNDLPTMPIRFNDGTELSVKTLEGKIILILFQPDCDHCQREAVQIRENLDAFKDHKLYFISSAPLPEIEKFAADYGLADKDGVYFAQTAAENVIGSFGPIEAPSLYLYSAEGKLVQSFNGEVDISVVLKYL